MSAATVVYSTTIEVPAAPPNTEYEGRSRANSLMSSGSGVSHGVSSGDAPSSCMANVNGPRRPIRNVAFYQFADALTQIQEEEPGTFYESSTGVPENTPYCTDEPSTPRSSIEPTTIDLPKLDERLEELPPPSSPAPSHFGGSVDNQSTYSEPLTMAIHRRQHSLTKPRVSDDSSSSPLPLNRATAGTPTSSGVREYTDWANDVEGDFQRSLACLANLANDDAQREPNKPAEQHYRERLFRLLNGKGLRFAYGDVGDAPMPNTTGGSNTPRKDGPPPYRNQFVTHGQLQEMEGRLLQNEQLTKQALSMHSNHVQYVKEVQRKFEKKIADTDDRLSQADSERESMKQDIKLLKKLMLKDVHSNTNAGGKSDENEVAKEHGAATDASQDSM